MKRAIQLIHLYYANLTGTRSIQLMEWGEFLRIDSVQIVFFFWLLLLEFKIQTMGETPFLHFVQLRHKWIIACNFNCGRIINLESEYLSLKGNDPNVLDRNTVLIWCEISVALLHNHLLLQVFWYL